MITNADNTKYIESQNIRVFPCAYRGYYVNGNDALVFDPEARSTTESNFTDTFHKLSDDKNSYLIAWVPNLSKQGFGTLKCVIGGYYFEIYNHTMTNFFKGDKPYYLCIKTTDAELGTSVSADSVRTTEVLSSFAETTDYLDIRTSDGYAFTGLLISEEATGTANLQPFKAESSYIKSIKAASDNKEAQVNLYYVNDDDQLIRITDIDKAAPNGTQLYFKSDDYSVDPAKMPVTNLLDLGNGRYSLRMLEDITEQGTNTTVADGDYAIALGKGTKALGEASTALGAHTTATADNQVVIGEYNYLDDEQAFIIAAGNSTREPTANKFTVSYEGDVKATGDLTIENNATIRGNTAIDGAAVIKGDVTANGNFSLSGKAQSSKTTSTDSDTTLTTKNYVDNLITGVNANHTNLSSTVTDLDTTLTQMINDAKTELDAAITNAKSTLENALANAQTTLQTNINTLNKNITTKFTETAAAEPTKGDGTGKYIISVTQADGKISATEGILVNNIDAVNEVDIPSPKAVADYVSTYVDDKVSPLDTKIAGIWNNATVKKESENSAGTALKSIILDAIYPIGAIYTHYQSCYGADLTTCPIQDSLGGYWKRISGGYFLRAAGEGITKGKGGGSADAIVVAHSHAYSGGRVGQDVTKSTESVGDHSHSMAPLKSTYSGTGDYTGFNANSGKDGWEHKKFTAMSGGHSHNIKFPAIQSNGQNGTNANLPPFFNVYMWVRVETAAEADGVLSPVLT